MGSGFDSIGEEIAAGSTFRDAFPRCWHWAALHFAVFPWFIVFVCVAARGCLQLRGFVLYAYLAVAGVALVLVYLGLLYLNLYLRAAADRSDAALIIYIIVTLVMSLAAHCCLQPHMKPKGTYSTSHDASLQLANRLCLQIQFCRDEVASQTLSGSVASEQARPHHQQPQRSTELPGARARNYRHSTSNFGLTVKTLAPPSAAALSRVASQHINVEAAARGTHRFRAVLYATSQQILESFSLRQRPRLSNGRMKEIVRSCFFFLRRNTFCEMKHRRFLSARAESRRVSCQPYAPPPSLDRSSPLFKKKNRTGKQSTWQPSLKAEVCE